PKLYSLPAGRSNAREGGGSGAGESRSCTSTPASKENRHVRQYRRRPPPAFRGPPAPRRGRPVPALARGARDGHAVLDAVRTRARRVLERRMATACRLSGAPVRGWLSGPPFASAPRVVDNGAI